MFLRQELLQRLKDFGMNSYEARIWVALLSCETATAGTLANMANVPRSRSYDVLTSLEEKGFVFQKGGKPLYYSAYSPDKVMGILKGIIKKKAEEQQDYLASLLGTTLFKELEILHKQGCSDVEPSDHIACLKGETAVLHHTISMTHRAQQSIFFWGHSEDLHALESLFQERHSNQCDVKCFVHGKPTTFSFPVKSTHSGKGRFLLIDKRELLVLPLDKEHIHAAYDCGIWAISPLFTSTLHSLFLSAWNNSKSPFVYE